jgi:hypothetical protein
MYPSHQYPSWPPPGPVYDYPSPTPRANKIVLIVGVVIVALVGWMIVLGAVYSSSGPSRDEWSYHLGYRAGVQGTALSAVGAGVNVSTACEEAEMADQEFRSRVIVNVDYRKGCMDGLHARGDI